MISELNKSKFRESFMPHVWTIVFSLKKALVGFYRFWSYGHIIFLLTGYYLSKISKSVELFPSVSGANLMITLLVLSLDKSQTVAAYLRLLNFTIQVLLNFWA